MNRGALARLAAVAACALPVALGACVTLFPKTTPVPLYRFGAQLPANAQPAPATFAA